MTPSPYRPGALSFALAYLRNGDLPPISRGAVVLGLVVVVAMGVGLAL